MTVHFARPLGIAIIATLTVARGQVVFSNNFETGTTGFVASGTLSGLTTFSLPTDGGGLASSNESNWLGKIGAGVGKTGSADEIVTLSLSGLSPGTTYSVAFDLLIGASWDGAASGYGPDSWRFAVNGTRLVDTIFSDYNGHNLGAGGAQRYSDTTFTNPNGPDQAFFAGSEFNVSDTSGYAGDYAIYYFGHGSGNPVLQFTPNSDGIAVLEFARYGNTTLFDSPDEYWALDNVTVTAIPEPAQFAPVAGLVALAAAFRARRSTRPRQTQS
jgi:hypothetical protein